MRIADTAFAAFTILLGSWIAWTAIVYGYSSNGNPGPGFFPFWVGLAMALLGAVNVWRAISGMEVLSETFDATTILKSLGITVAVAVYIAAAPFTGMLVGSAFLVLAIGFVIKPTLDPRFSLRLLAVAIGFPFAAWLIFPFYLGIRLIDGVLGF